MRRKPEQSQLNSTRSSEPLVTKSKFIDASLAILFAATALAWQTQEYKSGIVWPEPPVIDPGPAGGPPSDAVVLFDGKDVSKWQEADGWELKDGYGLVKSKAGVNTKDAFGDCQVHVEFATPEKVTGSGQG